MKLTILLAGENLQFLRDEYGEYADKFKNMLGGVNPVFTFQSIAIHAGEAFPAVSEVEGIIITGSSFGAYDAPEWMEPLRQFIRQAYRKNLPMLGICFGHQIMADALGGTVVKSEKGWSIGRHKYRLDHCPECFLNGPGELAIAAAHQDQVVVPPKEAEIFLSSDFTPIAGLIYKNARAMSLQPHPEFEVSYSKEICELRRDNPMSDAQVDVAVKSLHQPLDNDRVANALAQFFLNAPKNAIR